jgi:hypothetical protein
MLKTVGAGDGVIVGGRGRLGMDLEEEEAAKGEAASAPSQQLKEGARIAREEQGSNGREEEGTEAEGGEREGCGGSSTVRPVESRRLDGSGKCHTTSEAGKIGKEA